MLRKFRLEIKGKYVSGVQVWTESGIKGGNRVLRNVERFTQDTFLLMNDELNIVGGYGFIFNSGNSITVTQVGANG